jgi:hypothetical protein
VLLMELPRRTVLSGFERVRTKVHGSCRFNRESIQDSGEMFSVSRSCRELN